ncbi:tRNA/tmRNA/rRNA uracil-C5-methylase (TrmA/RlmC/RlmD family) [Nocardia kruczakiae]|uniref:tRNA/tmRNA/rRNA uracil-C5-methylase (TrmA/RlmC/RlmD family) n=1 Tax=Nocardia kruczakiae TaxID=261477 RepID=A0ABU1XQM6_9NOCA|nr:TRAM domain-containing protein [Nocardia kruczakiae]MDR7172316.1 tRNA/tmRNA/rRNA uracil-C5-methylase (TrmA/RlmC/RlmD family) [Nocardia kruczakiae]
MSAGPDWSGRTLQVRLGPPGHGGFCVARHEGRVLFVRHGLPGEVVRARVTEDRGGSFCRAEAIEILEPSADRVTPNCPVSGPGGAGCCDFAFATPEAQRGLKAAVVREQLQRLAHWDTDIVVEPLPLGPGNEAPAGGAAPERSGEVPETGWRTRVRLVVDAEGRAGVHRYRSSDVIADLRCPQPVSGAVDGIAESAWTPGAELVIAVDADGMRHVVELAPPSTPPRRGGDRRATAARRAAAHARRRERVVSGSGRAVQYVAGRRWDVSATGFWQPHRDAAQRYSDVVADWADLDPGSIAWDLYCGVGVFAARLAEQAGPRGSVLGVESARSAVADGTAALRDLPGVGLHADRVERWIATQDRVPRVVVLDPPRAGAGKQVVTPLAAAGPARIVHIGCDPAAFARDVGLYREAGYRVRELRAFDAFPATHHVECLALLERA